MADKLRLVERIPQPFPPDGPALAPKLARTSAEDANEMEELDAADQREVIAQMHVILYEVTEPLTERREVKTSWGMAWAEVGCRIAHNQETGAVHIIAPADFETQYRERSST